MNTRVPQFLLAFFIVALVAGCAAQPAIQTVEVPVTVVVWQTVEIPVTIIAVQTVEVPVTVEVVRTVLVTPAPSSPATLAEPAAALAPAPTATSAPTPTPVPAGPSAEVQAYLTVAKAQCSDIFGCLSDLSVFANAPKIQTSDDAAFYTAKLTMASGRISAVQNTLNSTTPPAELAEAHRLMLSACGYVTGAIQKAYRGDDAQEPLDRGYEDNVAAERLLNAAAGEE